MVKFRFSKILLVLAPLFWPKLPPIGIGFLQSFLLKNNIECSILDLNNIFYNLASPELKKSWLISCNTALEKTILRTIEENHPKEYENSLNKMLQYPIIGFSCFKSNFQNTLEIVKTLKTRNKDIKIILGGPEIARQYFKTAGKFDKQIKSLADYIVTGEGELHVLNCANGNIPSPLWGEGKGEGNTLPFNELPTLSSLPFPIYKGIDLHSYPRKNAISILLSRGCPKKCRFCSERLLYKKFRLRPIENVIDEINFHIINNNIQYFIFNDSMINANLKYLEELCDRLIPSPLWGEGRVRGSGINWEAQIAIRPDMSLKLLNKIKKSGCYNLFVGLESGCDRTLKNMNKGFTTKDAVTFFKKLNDANLFFGVSIIVGYPGETEKDFKESLNFILKNKHLIPKIEQVNPYVYYDGTSSPLPYGERERVRGREPALNRLATFTSAIKSTGFKYTNAFLGNLIEKTT